MPTLVEQKVDYFISPTRWVIQLLKYRQSLLVSSHTGHVATECNDVTVRRQVHGGREINSHASKCPVSSSTANQRSRSEVGGMLDCWLTPVKGWHHVRWPPPAGKLRPYCILHISGLPETQTSDCMWPSQAEWAHCSATPGQQVNVSRSATAQYMSKDLCERQAQQWESCVAVIMMSNHKNCYTAPIFQRLWKEPKKPNLNPAALIWCLNISF